MNIANFIEWFIQQFVNIGTFMIGKLDEIKIYGNVSLLNFIVTITIIGMFLTVLLTIPQSANKWESRYERRAKERNKEK